MVVVCGFTAAACSQGTPKAAQSNSPAPQVTGVAAMFSDSARLPDGITTERLLAGERLFNNGSCVHCHGKDAKGGPYGPNLTDDEWVQIDGSFDALAQVIASGVPADKQKLPSSQRAFAMRPRGGMQYTDEQILNLAGYVWLISHYKKK